MSNLISHDSTNHPLRNPEVQLGEPVQVHVPPGSGRVSTVTIQPPGEGV